MTRYVYTPEILQELELAISVPRLSTYLGDLRAAIELHAWNNSLAAALFIQVLNVELLVRNKCGYVLEILYNRADWYNTFPPIAGYDYLRSQIKDAQNKLTKLNKEPDYPPQITAHVTFGFWVALFEKHLHRDLLSFEARMLTLAGYISPEFAGWMKHHSRLMRVWKEKT